MKKLLVLIIFCSVPAVGMTAPSVAQERRRDDATERLFAAIKTRDMAAAERALEAGANVNQKDEDGRAPLHLAIFYGSLGIMGRLLQNNANINLQDYAGKTPLNQAISHLHEPQKTTVVNVLLEIGADPNIQDSYGNTPLHNAAFECSYGLAKLLVEKGAQVWLKNNNDETAIDIAREKCGEESAIHRLLRPSLVKGIQSK